MNEVECFWRSIERKHWRDFWNDFSTKCSKQTWKSGKRILKGESEVNPIINMFYGFYKKKI